MTEIESCPHCGREVARTDKICPHCRGGLIGKTRLVPGAGARPTTVSGGAIVLILVAVVAAIVGAGSLSNATVGVGLMAAACLLAIFARIAQAGTHHREVMFAIKWSNLG